MNPDQIEGVVDAINIIGAETLKEALRWHGYACVVLDIYGEGRVPGHDAPI